MAADPTVADLQGWLQAAVHRPAAVDPSDVGSLVEDGPSLTAVQRLAIYQTSYIGRLLNCLRAQFPGLVHALGQPLFDDFATSYIRACPPTSHSLGDLGCRFADHLEGTRPDRGQATHAREPWIDFMVDLARYERTLAVVFDGPGHEGNPATGWDLADERLVPSPSLALGAYRFPVAAYATAVQAHESPVIPAAATERLAFVRVDYRVHVVRLTVPQSLLLGAMLDGASVADGLARVAEELARPLPGLLQAWRQPAGTRRRLVESGILIAG